MAESVNGAPWHARDHGLFEEERRLGQKFTFDIDATLNPAPTHRDDRLDASIRYDAVVDVAVSLAGETKYQTLEALGEAVAIGLLRRAPLTPPRRWRTARCRGQGTSSRAASQRD